MKKPTYKYLYGYVFGHKRRTLEFYKWTEKQERHRQITQHPLVYKPAEVQEKLGVSDQALLRLVKRLDIPKHGPGNRYYTADDIRRLQAYQRKSRKEAGE